MIDMPDLEKFSTGLELEKEFNRIINLAFDNKISKTRAEQILVYIYNHGSKTGKFSKKDCSYYLKRKNCNRNNVERGHYEMALNIKKRQDCEHKVFEYFIKWLEKVNPNDNVVWSYHGSDKTGYIMIVNNLLKKVIEPDYRVWIRDEDFMVESKSFFSSPHFKIANLKKYISYGKKGCYLVFKYKNKYYLVGTKGVTKILELPKIKRYNQLVVEINDNDINALLEKKIMIRMNNDT